MKTIFTLLSSLFMSIAVFAAPAATAPKQKSTLTVKSADKSDIRVELDGRRFEPNDNSIMITGIDAGSHSIKVYREKSNGAFNIIGKRYEMVYSTTLMVKSKTNVTLTIDRLGRTSVSEQKINNNNGKWGNQRSFEFDRDGKFGDYDEHYGYAKAMSDREFRQVIQQIDKEWLETNKLKSATQIVTTNSLSAAQVKQMVLMFGFEANKLALAKSAYRNTVDKQNYYMINDAFSFSSSKDELNRFIRSSR